MMEETAKQTWDFEVQSNSKDIYRQMLEDICGKRALLFLHSLDDASLQGKDCFDFPVHVHGVWLSQP